MATRFKSDPLRQRHGHCVLDVALLVPFSVMVIFSMLKIAAWLGAAAPAAW